MKVAMVTAWYPSIASPVSGVFVRRDAELISHTHDVEIIHLISPELLSAADLENDRRGGIPITRIPMSRSNPLSLRRAWAPLDSALERFELVHTQAFPTLFAFAGRRVTLPWLHSEHYSGIADPLSLPPRGRVVVRTTAPLLRRPDVVTAVSTYLADRVRAHRRRGPVHIVPSVVAPAEVVARPDDPRSIRLVAIGSMQPGKDPLLALESLRVLHARGVSAELNWVGDGPLRAPVATAARPEDLLTLSGSLDRRGVSAALDAADIFVLPTRGETLCLSALEAITHGRPVVMGDRGGQRDYVVPDNGRLVHARTPEAYADAVLEVWNRRDSVSPDRVAATIGDRFQADRVLDGYTAAYELAVSRHKGPGGR